MRRGCRSGGGVAPSSVFFRVPRGSGDEPISPVRDPEHEERWWFDDRAGGRCLVIGYDHEGRAMVFSLHPHRFGEK